MTAITPQQKDLLAICALRAGNKSVDWNLIARTCQSPEALQVVLGGDIPEDSTVARKNLALLREALPTIDDARARVTTELEAAEKAGARLVTVLDPDYPANLRLVPNLPPSCSTSATSKSGMPVRPPSSARATRARTGCAGPLAWRGSWSTRTW